MNETVKKEKTTKSKKPVSLCEYHRIRLAAMVGMFVVELLTLISDHVNIHGSAALRVLNYVVLAAGLLLLLRWALFTVITKRPLEKDDELSRENMIKAHEKIGTVFWLILAVIMLISIFWEGSITIHFDSDFMNTVWILLFSGYFSLESGFFIYYDRKGLSSDDDGSEDDSMGDE